MFIEALDAVMGGATLKHPAHRGPHAGGEWEALLELRPRVRRRLTGARYLTRYGLDPDEAHELIAGRLGECRIPDPHAAVRWYCDTALRCIPEAQREARLRRNQRLADRHGHPTLYRYLDAWARDQGYDGYTAMRRLRWST